MSRSGIARAFGKHTGVSPGLIIRRARIEFAKRLLIEKDLPLKSIAALTGFSSENTFCIAFQRTTGLAPKKYQRKAWLTALSRR
jgi:transcriptional regulator GlxA family with amidase domain